MSVDNRGFHDEGDVSHIEENSEELSDSENSEGYEGDDEFEELSMHKQFTELEPDDWDIKEHEDCLKQLNTKQLTKMLENIQMQIDENKPRVEALTKTVGFLRRMKVTGINKRFIDARLALLDAEAYLWHLQKREAEIQNAMLICRPDPVCIPFPVNRLPKLLVCNPWKTKIPKIVIERKPENPGDVELSEEFKTCLSEEEFERIKILNLWRVFECGELQIQVAGLHPGQPIHITCDDNGEQRTLIDTRIKEEEEEFDEDWPCKDKKGLPGLAVPCRAFENKIKEIQPATMAISIVTTELVAEEKVEIEEPIIGHCENPSVKEEMDTIIRKTWDIQQSLDKAKLEAEKLMIAARECLSKSEQQNNSTEN